MMLYAAFYYIISWYKYSNIIQHAAEWEPRYAFMAKIGIENLIVFFPLIVFIDILISFWGFSLPTGISGLLLGVWAVVKKSFVNFNSKLEQMGLSILYIICLAIVCMFDRLSHPPQPPMVGGYARFWLQYGHLSVTYTAFIKCG